MLAQVCQGYRRQSSCLQRSPVAVLGEELAHNYCCDASEAICDNLHDIHLMLSFKVYETDAVNDM